jgi:glycerol uptake facilitator-like aquaporin
MVVAEFLGTGVLTLVIVSVQRSTIGIPYFVGLAAGLAAGLLVLVFNRVSGAMLNPALTLGLWTARRLKTVPALVAVAAQLLGGFAAGALYKYFVNGPVAPISHDFSSRVLVGEAVGAAIFTMAVAAAVYNLYGEAKKAAVYAGGLALGVIAASSASASILNPAVALGANAWAWMTYVLGPVLGGVIGVNLYGLLFAPASAVNATATAAATGGTPAVATTATRPARKTTAKKATAKKTTAKKRTTTKRK